MSPERSARAQPVRQLRLRDPPLGERHHRLVQLHLVDPQRRAVDLKERAHRDRASTWLVGRLATRQDRARIADATGDADLLARLPGRTFLVHTERGGRMVRSRQTLSVLRGPLTRQEVGALGQRWSGGRPDVGMVAPPLPRSLSPRWLDPAGVAAVGAGVEPVFRALVYARLRTPGGIVHRAAWGDGLEEVREVVLEDRWLHRVPVRGPHGPAPSALYDDDAVVALRERWVRRVAEEVGARRFEVELVGVIVVWVRRG